MSSSTKKNDSSGFTEAEKKAMRERAKELKKEARAREKREAGEADVFEKIAEMPDADKAMATRLHELITETAPELWPRTWYGMPAYTLDDKVVCFFQAASKFDARYGTLGFNDTAQLDDGVIWPTAFAVTKMTRDVEKQVVALVKKAVGR